MNQNIVESEIFESKILLNQTIYQSENALQESFRQPNDKKEPAVEHPVIRPPARLGWNPIFL